MLFRSNSLLPDEEKQKNIYISLDNLIKNLENKNWPIIYSFWEVNLIRELGFGFKTEKTNLSKDKYFGNRQITQSHI